MSNIQNIALDRLRDDLVLPCAARCPMSPEQAAAWWSAPLVTVTTSPPAVALHGFADGRPVAVGTLTGAALPDGSMEAVARFLDIGLGTLGADVRDEVIGLISDGHASLVVNIRADAGTATCYLVTRGDAAKPVVLFALQASDEVPH